MTDPDIDDGRFFWSEIDDATDISPSATDRLAIVADVDDGFEYWVLDPQPPRVP